MSEESEQREASVDVRALGTRIDEGWSEVLIALDGIPEERLEEPGACGAWSAKNLMGHLACWNDHVSEEIESALAGQPVAGVDVQALNEGDQAARERRTLAEEREAMARAHEAVIKRLKGAKGFNTARLDQAIGGHTYGHYAAYARDLQRWRQRVGL